MNEPEVVQMRYSITLTVEEFQKILDKDKEEMDGNGNFLHVILKRETSAEDIEYDGMFGAHIWFTFDKFGRNGVAVDVQEELVYVVDIIKNYIK